VTGVAKWRFAHHGGSYVLDIAADKPFNLEDPNLSAKIRAHLNPDTIVQELAAVCGVDTSIVPESKIRDMVTKVMAEQQL
jgi:hypothetical protein